MNAYPQQSWRAGLVASLLVLSVVACAPSAAPSATAVTPAASASPSAGTFTNPLLPSGPDPWALQYDGFYYYMSTTGRNLTLLRTRNIADLADAERKIVWTPPETGPYSRNLWAPEIHRLEEAWYIYFAADDGNNYNHRMWVVENPSPDPFTGEWTLKGKIADASDRWAIDGSVFSYRGRSYFIWSGWEGEVNGMQSIYIAPMANPWSLAGERVRISSPEYPWERNGELRRVGADSVTHVYVNEGPQALIRDDRLFIVYSASGCWTDDYALGMLTARTDADLLEGSSWSKAPEPVFRSDPAGGVYAPGHNSFFESPDGTEDWILYHANPEPGAGCGGRRSPRAQPFRWRAEGTPDFGRPVPEGRPLPRPSGEPDVPRVQ